MASSGHMAYFLLLLFAVTLVSVGMAGPIFGDQNNDAQPFFSNNGQDNNAEALLTNNGENSDASPFFLNNGQDSDAQPLYIPSRRGTDAALADFRPSADARSQGHARRWTSLGRRSPFWLTLASALLGKKK